MQNHILTLYTNTLFLKRNVLKQNIGYNLLQQTEYISDEQYESINTDCLEILKLLTATIVKLKNNGNAP